MNHVDITTVLPHSNETLYLFGNNYDGIFRELAALYVTPPCKDCEQAGAKTIGIGGKNTGVSWHLHGPGYAETIIGSKRWFFINDSSFKLKPNQTTLAFLQSDYSQVSTLIYLLTHLLTYSLFLSATKE